MTDRYADQMGTHGQIRVSGEWAGIRIRESVWLTVAGDPVQVRCTWWARLFSWPWRPWQATYTVVPQIPNPQMFKMPDGSMVGHPATVAKLKRAIDARKLYD